MKRTFNHFSIQPMNLENPQVFFSLIDKNRPRLEDYFAGTVSKTKSFEDTVKYLNGMKEKLKNIDYLSFLIIDTKLNKTAGFMDLKNTNMSIPKGELGYFIDVDYEGKGIASKALSILIDYLIETYHFKKLLCRAGANNIASIEVIKKNHFELEGTIRRDYKTTDGTIVDMLYYGRLF